MEKLLRSSELLLLFVSAAVASDSDMVVKAGDACPNRGSALMMAGEPCLMYKTIDVPVDKRFKYTAIYCMDSAFDNITVETWVVESQSKQDHVAPKSINEYMNPAMNDTMRGNSFKYYVFEDYGIVYSLDNMQDEIHNLTWKETVTLNGKTIFSNEHRCLIRGVSSANSLKSGTAMLTAAIASFFVYILAVIL